MAISREITIINVPSDIGSMIKGKSLAPAAFQSVELFSKLKRAGYDVNEVDALPDGPRTWNLDSSFEPNGARNEEANVEVNHKVKNKIMDVLKGKTSTPPFQLIVGGECNIVPAIMSGLWNSFAPQRMGLVYMDGDADLVEPEPGSYGHLAAMTFTHLAMTPAALESMKPFTRPDGTGVVDSTNTVVFGLNAAKPGNTPSQIGYLMDEGYRVFTSAAVAKDPELRAKQALEYLEPHVDRILVHLDVDAIDAARFPLANVPDRTGASFEQVMKAIKVFLASSKVCGLVIAEVNPDHDPGLKMTSMLADELVDGLKRRL